MLLLSLVEQELQKFISVKKKYKMAFFFWFSFSVFVSIIAISIYQRFKSKKEEPPIKVESKVIELTDESFEEIIQKGVTLVDFWAPWCAPCRRQDPIVTDIANEVGDTASICKINVDEYKNAARKMKIKNIPNIIIFKDGVALKQIIGAKPKRLIMGALSPLLD